MTNWSRRIFTSKNVSYLSNIGLTSTGFFFVGVLYLGNLSPIAMRESPVDAALHIRPNDMVKFISQESFDLFRKDGIVVIDNVLTIDELSMARLEVNNILDNNSESITSTKKTQVSFSINDQNDLDIRSDLVTWVSECIGNGQNSLIGPGVLRVLRCIRSIPFELQELGLDGDLMGVPFSNQLACYNGGKSHYLPHRDALDSVGGSPEGADEASADVNHNHKTITKPASQGCQCKHPFSTILQGDMEQRRITIIIYLNDEQWDSTAGGLADSGHLRVFVNAQADDVTGETASSIRDIEPRGILHHHQHPLYLYPYPNPLYELLYKNTILLYFFSVGI